MAGEGAAVSWGASGSDAAPSSGCAASSPAAATFHRAASSSGDCPSASMAAPDRSSGGIRLSSVRASSHFRALPSTVTPRCSTAPAVTTVSAASTPAAA